MIAKFSKWWHSFVPLEVKDITQEWVQEALSDVGIQGRLRDVEVKWLSEGEPGAGGATGAKLFRVVASFEDGQSMVMVYKATYTNYYGQIPWGARVMFAIMEPGIHSALALGHNMPFNEWDYYDAFVVKHSMSPGLPGPQLFAAPKRGAKVSRVGLFTGRWYHDAANGLLMEDLTNVGFRGYGPFVEVGTEVAHAALLDLARFHAGHWGKPYVPRKAPSVTVRHWFGQSVLDNAGFRSRLERTTSGRLVRDLITARAQGHLVKCNIPDRVPRPDLFRPGKARSFLPELFEPEDGPFFSAMRVLETGGAALVAHARRILASRETLIMGDAHSGNLFMRPTSGRAPASGGVETRWIDFQHWGSGAAALELAYFFMGGVDALPGRDDALLRAYHAELVRHGVEKDFDKLRADLAASILLLAAAALFHYPTHSWPGGSGIISCQVDPNNPGEIQHKIRESEKGYRMVYRMIQRVPLILGDDSHPLTRELRACHAEVQRARAAGKGPRSRL